MTSIIVLDVVIGLVFIYLLYSLLATIIQELIATMFRLRSKNMEHAIYRMLDDDKPEPKLHPLIALFKKLVALFKKLKKLLQKLIAFFKMLNPNEIPNKQTNLTNLFYSHPLIKYLAEDDNNKKPSYITKENFSKVVIDLLRGFHLMSEDETTIKKVSDKSLKDLIDETLKGNTLKWNSMTIGNNTIEFLRSLWFDAQGEIDTFRLSLEKWFDDTMERCTGWYIKQTQKILLVIGLLIAIAFNVDTISIVGKLQKDPKLREAVLQQADVFVKSYPYFADSTDNNPKDSLLIERGKELTQRADSLIKTDISKVNGLMGLGWSNIKNEHKGEIPKEGIFKKASTGFIIFIEWLSTILGWIITALAISMGAPFWFDLLNKLMKVRNSINIPTESQEKGKTKVQSAVTKRKG